MYKKKEEKRKHQIFSKTRSFVILFFEKSTSLDIFKNKAEKAREKDHRSSFLLFAKFNDVFEREIIIELKNCSWENAMENFSFIFQQVDTLLSENTSHSDKTVWRISR